jgi:diaminopimelate epimerase
MTVFPDALLKVEGAGNDFVLGVGSWARRLADDGDIVRRLCDRRRGIGADGALALFPRAGSRFRLAHRNADGSPSAFCANGTRCAARAAVELYGASSEMVIATGWVEIPAAVGPEAVTLELPPTGPIAEVRLETRDRTWSGWTVEVGVPHLVLLVSGLDDLDVAAVAGPLRRHPSLGDSGANVHLVEPRDDAIAIRSMERGVGHEVWCCGSGAVASALVTMATSGSRRLTVRPRSGDRLTVAALGEPPSSATRLTGPARLVAGIEPFADWEGQTSAAATASTSAE